MFTFTGMGEESISCPPENGEMTNEELHRFLEFVELYQWTMLDIRAITGVSKQQAYAWFNGDALVPAKHLVKIGKHYNIDFRDFYKPTVKGVKLNYPAKAKRMKGKTS